MIRLMLSPIFISLFLLVMGPTFITGNVGFGMIGGCLWMLMMVWSGGDNPFANTMFWLDGKIYGDHE